MKNFDELLGDVLSRRRAITRVIHECTGRGAITVTLDDGQEIDCTASEARELVDAGGQDDSVLFDWLG